MAREVRSNQAPRRRPAISASLTAGSTPLVLSDCPLGLVERLPMSFECPYTGSTVPHPNIIFGDLQSFILALSDLPLSVREFRASDPDGHLRLTSRILYCPWPAVDAPQPGTSVAESAMCGRVPTWAPQIVIQCVLEFERSGAWPRGDVNAIRRTKAALLLALRDRVLAEDELPTSFGNYLNCRVGGLSRVAGAVVQEIGEDNKDREGSMLSDPFLDVTVQAASSTTSGPCMPEIVFRIVVFHPYEHLQAAILLTEASADILAAYSPEQLWQGCHGDPAGVIKNIADHWWRPAVAATFEALARSSLAFSASVRLLKQWADAQLLRDADDVLEHLAFHVFTNPLEEPPTTAEKGFFRTLQLLAYYDWQEAPLVVNYQSIQASKSSEPDGDCIVDPRAMAATIQEAFKRSREAFAKKPAPSWNRPFRNPSIWISSYLDPHCQLIKVPYAGHTRSLIKAARYAVGVYLQRSDCLTAADITSSMSNNEWPAPVGLEHLGPQHWRERKLFQPWGWCGEIPTHRITVELQASPDAGKIVAGLRITDTECKQTTTTAAAAAAGSGRISPFLNVPRKKQKQTFSSTISSPIGPHVITLQEAVEDLQWKPERERLHGLILEALRAPQVFTTKKSRRAAAEIGATQLSQSDDIDERHRTCNSKTDLVAHKLLQKSELQLNFTHEAIGVLATWFSSFVRRLECSLQSTGYEVYFNSSQFPFPTEIHLLKFEDC